MKRYLAILGVVALISCKKNDKGIAPSERNLQNINTLRKELTSASHGWKVIYFSKTDSLSFTNRDEVFYNGIYNYKDLYGYGGHYFVMQFKEDGTVQMLADFDKKSIAQVQKSQFEVRQNTFTQLSFTTYNYLHQLVNEHFSGASDFLYIGKDFFNNLIFKTASYIEPAREYILFEPLQSPIDWENSGNTLDNVIEKAHDNRVFFTSMKNPQLEIRKGSRIYFQSDVLVKSTRGTPAYNRFLQEMIDKRYYVFLFNKKPDLVNPNIARESNGLGSGYVGTEHGISFHTGIRYDQNYIFYDFERKNNRFICELVRVYNPFTRKYMLLSKHLHPEGEPTHFVAEIIDKQ